MKSWRDVATAIADMIVRGAPAIGISAAYGMALAAKSGDDWSEARNGLAASRPTAVNLFWALARMDGLQDRDFESVLAEAKRIEHEDFEINKTLAHHGATLVGPNSTALTICNTGALATGGHGTALGILRTAFSRGNLRFVYACETRPRLQGLRLTAWELDREGIPFSMIADSAAASLMSQQKIDFVVVGADRIAANGDTANKIGTYALAVLARYHRVPFYVAAPSTTLDPETASGDSIPIEERGATELLEIDTLTIAPPHFRVYNPAFDITPGNLIDAIVTEHGVIRPPYNFRK